MDRDELIMTYYDMGLTYRDISRVISEVHHQQISSRQVIRILKRLGLGRRQNYTPIDTVIDSIREILLYSGQFNGYRMLWSKLKQRGIRIQRDIVNAILSVLDPYGMENAFTRSIASTPI